MYCRLGLTHIGDKVIENVACERSVHVVIVEVATLGWWSDLLEERHGGLETREK
jgi:hypothetical protein